MNATDREATFQRWTLDHGAILHRVAAGFAAGPDRADLMQELLLALWSAAPAFRGEASAATFVYRVSHNAALAWTRADRRRRRRLDEGASVDELAAVDEGDDPRRERLERVYEHIRGLPEVERSLILLSLDGLSYREMAAIHGLTETNVGARLSRCRTRLAHDLKENLDDPR